MTNVLRQQLSYFFTWSSNHLLNLNISFFRLFYLSTRLLSVLTLEAIHRFANLFRVSGCLLSFFRCCECCFPFLRRVICPHVSQITTWGTLFTERLFSVSTEWVRSWSHASLIIYHKTFAKKLKAVRPKSCREGEEEKEQVQSWSHVSWITTQ